MSQASKANLIRLKLKCHVSCSPFILNAIFLPKCLLHSNFKRNNFAYKFQECPFTDRYNAKSVFALLFH